MRRILYLLLSLFGLFAGTIPAATLSLAPWADTGLRVEARSPSHCRITLEIASLEFEELELEGQTWRKLSLPGAANATEAGYPDLPLFATSLAAGGQGILSVQLVEEQVETLEGFRVAPSRGSLAGVEQPELAPWTFGPAYGESGIWPAERWSLGEPFTFRDVQGQTLRIQPFQVDAGRQQLHVTTRMVLDVRLDAAPAIDPAKEELDATFLAVYKRHFDNWGGLRYDYLPAVGSMIVICPDDWLDELLPYVRWKNELGLATELVPLSAIGANAFLIDNWLATRYQTDPFTFILLIGDHQQLPTQFSFGSARETEYGMILGGPQDHYPEAIVGRYSAQTTEELEIMLERTRRYVLEPDPSATWYSRTLGVASPHQDGDEGESDSLHIRNVLDKLLTGDYTEAVGVYDDSVSTQFHVEISAEIHEGVGLVNYCGHGNFNRWTSPSFSTQRVDLLTNTDRWPFVVNAACNIGDFTNYDNCYAESWLRASHEGEPTGGLAVYASTVYAGWNPPMEMQDEFNELLARDSTRTFGGLCINGGLSMAETYDTGTNEFIRYAIFGDPSLEIRTQAPRTMEVQHPATYMPDAGPMQISVPGEPGVLAAISVNGTLASSSYADQEGNLSLELPAASAPEVLLLSVSGANVVPYAAEIAQNQEPVQVLAFDPVTILEDEALRIENVPGFYEDADGDSITIVEATSDVTGFTLDVQGEDLVVIPSPNWSGAATITLSLTDGNYVFFADQPIQVTPVNDAPLQVLPLPEYTVPEDGQLAIADPRPYFEDIDGPGVVELSDPLADHGEITWDGDSLHFIPWPDYSGVTEIYFDLSDGIDTAQAGPFPILVVAVNDPPAYFGDLDNYVVEEDGSLQLQLSDLFGDIDGDSLEWHYTFIANGSIDTEGPQMVIAPEADYFGEMALEVRVTDGEEIASSGLASITVLSVNDAPELLQPFPNMSSPEDSLLLVADLYEHFRDVDGDPLQFSFSVDQGALALEDSLLLYTPPPDFNGTVPVQLSAFDGEFTTEANAFSLTIFPVEDDLQQVIPFEDLVWAEDSSILLPGILNHFFSVDADTLFIQSWEILDPEFSGELEEDDLLIHPPPDFAGESTLRITVADDLDRNQLTVDIPLVVEQVNDAPQVTICNAAELPCGEVPWQGQQEFWWAFENEGVVLELADVEGGEMLLRWIVSGNEVHSETILPGPCTAYFLPQDSLLQDEDLHIELVDGDLVWNLDGSECQWQFRNVHLQEPELPSAWFLAQNVPNPFNPDTRIRFGMPREGAVRLAIYNLRGQQVALLVDDFLPAGEHEQRWQPEGLASGVYLYSLQGSGFRKTRKLTLLR